MWWKFKSSRSRIELRGRTIFRCDKCWQYSSKVKCMKCYPSKCFPLFCEKTKPDIRDFERYKKWDSWYLWRYLLAPKMDEEEKYSIFATLPYTSSRYACQQITTLSLRLLTTTTTTTKKKKKKNIVYSLHFFTLLLATLAIK